MKMLLFCIVSVIALAEGIGLFAIQSQNDELIQEKEALERANRYLKTNYCCALRTLDICGVHAGIGLNIDIDSLPDYRDNERDQKYRESVENAEKTAATFVFDGYSF